MSSIEFGANGFKFFADDLNDPITRFRRKKRFKSINAIFRWFKVRKFPMPTEVFLLPAKYTETIQLAKGVAYKAYEPLSIKK